MEGAAFLEHTALQNGPLLAKKRGKWNPDMYRGNKQESATGLASTF
jgi:hypothetical protein